MRQIVVSGAAGFVGANLARRAVQEGHAVHAFVRPGSDGWRLAGTPGLTVYEVDICDARAIERVTAEIHPQWVFHCAAYGAYAHQDDPRRMHRTNLEGTVNLLQAGLRTGVEVFINTGSSSEYGYQRHPHSETDTPAPNSAYALSKLWATEYCRYIARTTPVVTPTLRLYSAYGPFEAPGRLMPALVAAATTGTLPPLADPATARDFVYIDDVCDAYLAAASAPPLEPGAIFNVGSGLQTSLAALVDTVRDLFAVEATPRWGAFTSRAWDTPAWQADVTKIESVLGWRAHTPLREGLTRLMAWMTADRETLRRYQ